MRKYIVLSLLTFIVIISNNACTLIGGYIGYKNRDVEYKKSDNEVLKLSADEEITVIKQNSDTLAGKFVKYNKTSYEDYSKSYNANLVVKNKKFFLPNLGQTVSASINNYNNKITFRGFDFGTIYYNSPTERGIKSIPFKNVSYLRDSTDKKYTIESIQNIINENRIPLYSQIVLQNNNKTLEINSEHILTIVTKSSWGIFGGMALGAVVDALVIFIIRDMLTLNFGGGLWGKK